MDHQRAGKEVIRYIQRTKGFILVSGNCDELKIIVYNESKFAGSFDDIKSSYGNVFELSGGAIS